jgi:hypothetical protein
MKDFETTKNKGHQINLSKLISVSLFFANWLFMVSLSKKIVDSPEGDLDFLVKNLATFLLGLVLTGFMIHFSSKKVMVLLIPVMAALALAVSLG